MTIHERLRTLRVLRGLTQEELAQLTGIPNTYLSLIETGKVVPAGEWEIRIRAALGWTEEMDAKLDTLKELNS